MQVLSDGSPRRLLVVDDDLGQRRLMGRIGERAGYQPTAADGLISAQRALDAGLSFDVAALDLSLGENDGLELLSSLAECARPPSILFVSSFDERVRIASQRVAASLGLHVLGSLGKPINPAATIELLRSARTRGRITFAGAPDEIAPERLARAIRAGRIRAMFQPKVTLATGRTNSAEVLARWTEPDGKEIPPSAFISVAEENGLIPELTRSILDQAAAACRKWQDTGTMCSVAVNVSPVLLDNSELAEFLEAPLRRHGISPGAVTLEITESVIIPRSTRVIEGLTRLRIRGFGLSIDDFGTGHSSLLSVMRLPFSELKIDQVFVRNADRDPDARKIVGATTSLARELGLLCVAEGVERPEIEAILRATSCDVGQGWLYGRAMSADALAALLARQ